MLCGWLIHLLLHLLLTLLSMPLPLQAAEYREKLIDMIVEQDDAVLEKYFEVRTRQGFSVRQGKGGREHN